MDKQELIDKAVEQFSGKYPAACSMNKIMSYRAGKGDKYNTYYPFYVWYSESEYDICTDEEFTIRARELGWINGYKWGVEYQTNGKKPDLPDDVLVKVLDCGSWNKSNVTCGEWYYKDGWHTKFRIVDERYKPKESESRSKQITDNPLYEFGDLPAIGVECEAYISSRDVWAKVKIVGHDHDRAIWRNGTDGTSYIGSALHDLRPIKTERELLIDIITSTGNLSEGELADAILAAGFTNNKEK